MAIFHDIQHLPHFNNPVLTTGTFDGVHKGHRAILREVVNHASQVSGDKVSILADRETPDWVWFEPGLSYDNARLCEALIVTGFASS